MRRGFLIEIKTDNGPGSGWCRDRVVLPTAVCFERFDVEFHE